MRIVERVRYILNLVIVALLLLTVAINRNGKIVGTPVNELFVKSSSNTETIIKELPDGTEAISSLHIGKDITGYGGATPIELYIKDNKIIKVEALENSETPDFMNSAIQAGILEHWNGLPLNKAIDLSVDAVSGATLTSNAIISTVKRTVEYKLNNITTSRYNMINAKSIVGLLVVILGIIISFIGKSPKMRIIQLTLNVIVLGFWLGSFLSLSLITNWLSNGVNLSIAAVPLALLLSAIVMPLFGKKGHYCAWHCPLGSLQEIAGKSSSRKINIPQRANKYLNNLREIILLTLLFTMWLGVGFSLMDYELFSAFLFRTANEAIVIMAILFITLSLFIQRPYCRFVCPTGALLKLSTHTKER